MVFLYYTPEWAKTGNTGAKGIEQQVREQGEYPVEQLLGSFGMRISWKIGLFQRYLLRSGLRLRQTGS